MLTKKAKLMGASIHLAVDHPQAEEVLNKAIDKIQQFERRFSANDPRSELSYLNQHAHRKMIKVHPQLFKLIEIGLDHSLEEDSYLNIAVGPLVQLWRIGFQNAQVPKDEEIKEILPLIDPKNIILDRHQGSVGFKVADMAIDLGALAKGYAADLLKGYLQKSGAQAGLIDLGGNILTFGSNPNRQNGRWNIGLQDPKSKRGEHFSIVKTFNQSVVTSGVYVRQLEYQGKKYHHIFDSQTGYPIETNVTSLTIISKLSVDGEIWTSRLFGYPVNTIIEKIEAVPHIEGVVMTEQGVCQVSSGAGNLII